MTRTTTTHRSRALQREERPERTQSGGEDVDAALALVLAPIARELTLDVRDGDQRIARDRLRRRAVLLRRAKPCERLAHRVRAEQHDGRAAIGAHRVAVE